MTFSMGYKWYVIYCKRKCLFQDNMKLEERLRVGFFLLGKTRYSLGSHAVSALQLPTEDREVEHLAHVVTTPVILEGCAGDITYHTVEARFEDPVVQVNGEKNEEHKRYSEDGESQDGLRKRLPRTSGNTEEENEVCKCEDGASKPEISSKENEESTPCTVNRDPIRWFSALPPSTLRQAQKDFKSAVSLVAACATTQLKLRAANKEFRRLHEIKSKLDRVEKEA